MTIQLKNKVITIGVVILSCAFFAQTGCVPLVVGGAAGVGAAIYVKGNIEQQLNVSALHAHRSSIAALKSMHMPIIKDEYDATSASIESKFADDTTAWITIKALTDTSCELKVRVGTFGEEARARMIVEKIEKHLK